MDFQIILIIVAVILLGYMLAYIYRPEEKQERPRIPLELLQGDDAPDDPFRSPEAMDRRLEDFGRFNTRYNEIDGTRPIWEMIRRWFR